MRVREICSHRQTGNFALAPHQRRSALRSAGGEGVFQFAASFRLSQLLHFCVTLDIGWPLCWTQQLRPVYRSCGLLECLDPDIEFNLIKDENLGGNEPDCETDHERPERE